MRTERSVGRLRTAALCALVAVALACGERAPAPRKPAKPAGPQRTVTIPNPQAVAVPDLAVAVRINRLDQLLPKIETVVSPVVASVTADSLRGQLGAALGDPTLSGLDQTRAALLCVFDPAEGAGPAVAALIPVTSDQYTTTLQMWGLLSYQKEGGKTLLVSRSEAAQVAGRQAFDQLEALLSQPMPSDLSAYVNLEMLMVRHGDDIEATVEQMVQTVEQMQEMTGQSPGAAQILGLEVQGALSVAKEIKDLQVDVSLGNDGAVLGVILRAKPNTLLAKALEQKAIPDTSLVGYVAGTGGIVGCIGGDSDTLAEFLGAKVEEVLAATAPAGESPLKPAELKAYLERSLGLTSAVAFDYLTTDTESTFNGVMVLHVTDPEAYETMLRNVQKNLDATGLTDLYTSMGMSLTMTFKEKVREHDGVAIHQLIQDMKAEQITQMEEMFPPMAALMKNFTHMEYEVAFVGDYVVYDLGSQRMDATIDALKARKPLATTPLTAQQIFPKEGIFYMDLHPGRLATWGVTVAESVMGEMLAAMGPQVGQITASLKTLETKPISAFATAYQGKLQAQLFLPVDPIVKIKDVLTGQALAPQPATP